MNSKAARKLRKATRYHPTKSNRQVIKDKYGTLRNAGNTPRFIYQLLKKDHKV